MLVPLITNEWTKLRKRSLFWAILALLTGIALLMFGSMYYFTVYGLPSGEPNPELQATQAKGITWPLAFFGSFGLVEQFGPMVVVVLIGAIIGQDYSWCNLRFWLSRGVSRNTLLLGKLLGSVPAVLAVVSIPVLLTVPVTAIFTNMLEGTVSLGSVNWLALFLSLLRTVCVLMPYASLAILLGVLGRSPIAAIGGGIAITVAENLLVQLGLGRVAFVSYLPRALALSASVGKQAIAHLPLEYPSPALITQGAELATLAWAALLLGAALYVFQRQDIAD